MSKPTDLAPEMMEEFALARALVKRKLPYLMPGVAQMAPFATDKVETIKVSKGFITQVNPDWWATLTMQQRAAKLARNVLMTYLNYETRSQNRDKAKFAVALDRVIHPILQDAGLQLVEGDVLPEDIKMPRGLTAEQYYKAAEDQGEDTPDQENGSNAGGDDGDLPEGAEEFDRSDKEVRRALKEVAQEVLDKPPPRHGGSRTQGNAGGGNDGGWSELSGAARDLIVDDVAPTKLNWRRALQALARRRVRISDAQGKLTFRHMSRRNPRSGLGVPIMPGVEKTKSKIALAIDTSGSMFDSAIFGRIAAEIDTILKKVTKNVRILSFDTHVRADVPNVKDIKRSKSKLFTGGGGTSFVDVLQKVMEDPPEVVVLFTDCAGEWPQRPLPSTTTLVVCCIDEGSYYKTRPPEHMKAKLVEIDDSEEGEEEP